MKTLILLMLLVGTAWADPSGWIRLSAPWHDAAGAAAALDGSASRLVTASRDDTLRFWDLEKKALTGVVKHPLGKGDVVLAWAGPEGADVVVAGPDNALRWWRAGALSKPFAKTEAPVNDIAVGPRFELAFTTEKAVWLVRNGSAKKIATEERPAAVAFSRDGKWLAAGGGGEFGWAKLFTATGEHVRDLVLDTVEGPAHPSKYITPVADLAFHPSGRRVAAATYRGATVWDPATGLLRSQNVGPESMGGLGAQRVAWSVDGSELYALHDTDLWIWRGATHDGTVKLPWSGHAGYGFDVVPAANAIAFVGLSGEVGVAGFDGKLQFEMAGPRVRGMAFTPAGELAVSTPTGLQLRDPKTMTVLAQKAGSFGRLERCGDRLAVTTKETVSLRRFDLSEAASWPLAGRASALGCDARQVFVGYADGRVVGWPLGGGAAVEFKGAEMAITGVAAHGEWVAAVGESGRVYGWARDGSPIATLDLPGKRRPLTAAAFDRDGRLYTATGFLDGNPVLVWDLSKKAVARTLTNDKFGVTDLAFGPKGAVLTAHISAHAELRLPRAGSKVPGTGKPLRFEAVDGYGSQVAISDDGAFVALSTTGQEQGLRVWKRLE